MHIVPLAASLEPNTTYTLWRNGGIVAQFRTTAVPDNEAPGSVAIDDVAIDYVDRESSGSSCGVNRLAVSGQLALPADAASVWVRFRGAGQVQERLLPATAAVLRVLGTSYCAVHIDLEPDTTYELDVWARDLAGNEGPVTTTSVYIRNGGCTATPSSGFLLCALSLMIRRRRVAGVHPRA